MRTTTRVSAVVAAFLSLGAMPAVAQSANINAIANVFQAITVTGANTLDFGNVFPGVAKTIGVAAATAGRFDLTGQGSAPVQLTFTLPTNLTSGANSLPIGTWTGCTNPTNSTTGCTTFTPSGTATNSAFSAGGALFVFVGGTVTPAAAQAAGSYTGTITLTANY
jgi:Mat/Ecp fimbriae major subunit